MVEVEIRTPTFNEEEQQIGSEGIALVRVVDGEITLYGEESSVPIAPVMSLTLQRSVDPADDPEEWARNLPYAYRSGDLEAVLLRDDAPPVFEDEEVDDEPAVPDPPMPAFAEEAEAAEVVGA